MQHGLIAPEIEINTQIKAVSPAPVAMVFASRIVSWSEDKF